MTITRRLLLLLFAGLLGVVGCGDDDDDTNASTDDTTEDAGGDGGGDVEAYCEKAAEIETIPEPEIDFESSSPEEIAEAVKTYAAEEFVPLADELEKVVPEEIAAEAEVLIAATRELAETGDFEATFESPEVKEAEATVHAFDLESCGWQRVDVIAKDYEFEGIPAELEAGTTSLEFANEGTELHEMLLLRKNDDVTETWDELLALPEEEARPKTTSVGAAFGAPGDEGLYAVADLTAGEYLAICFIPVGTVDEESAPEGPPHFTQGMKHEFRVS